MPESFWNPAQAVLNLGLAEAVRIHTAGKPVVEARRVEAQLQSASEMLGSVSDDDIGFNNAGLCQTFLPHSRPKSNADLWVRQSGRLKLIVRPGAQSSGLLGMTRDEAEREAMYVGVPWGAKARLILIYLQSEAVRLNRREVKLGKSMTEWLGNLGVTRGGGETAAVRDQALRIGHCTFTLEWEGPEGGGFSNLNIVEGLSYVHEARTRKTWPEYVHLEARFFEHLREHAVPIDKRAIEKLGGNALALDLYCLFVHRLPKLKVDLRLTWKQLNDQLGTGYASPHSLAEKIREVLPAVLVLYPNANLNVDRHGLILKPSPRAIPKNLVNGFRLIEGSKG